MKRILGLLLGLAIVLPICHELAPLSGPPANDHFNVEVSNVLLTGISRCPTGSPDQHQCAPNVDAQLNISRISPRPDAGHAFGTAPATRLEGSVAADPRHARAPDLHALNISRT